MRAVVALVAALALPGCGGDTAPSPGGPPTEAAANAAPPAEPGAPAPPPVLPDMAAFRARREAERRPPPPAPLVALLVNGQGDGAKVVAGWPVVVRLEMASPDGRPWRVSGGSGPWSRLVRLVQSGDGAWPFEPALEAPNEVTVDERNVATLHWTIAPEASAQLPKGERTLRAVVEAAPSGSDAWAGSAASQEMRVTVVDEPKPLPPAWAERKAEAEVDYAFCREGAAPALARADAALAAQPKSWRLAAMRGNVLAKLERRDEATAAIERAINVWHEHHGNDCGPPWELLAMRDLLAPPEPAPIR